MGLRVDLEQRGIAATQAQIDRRDRTVGVRNPIVPTALPFSPTRKSKGPANSGANSSTGRTDTVMSRSVVRVPSVTEATNR